MSEEFIKTQNGVFKRNKQYRMQDYDYGSDGAYFITICIKDREHIFGEVVDGKMKLSNIGKVADEYWLNIPKFKSYIGLGEYVVMPNHIHGILIIDNPTRNGRKTLQKREGETIQKTNKHRTVFQPFLQPESESISLAIRSYKSAVTKWMRENSNLEQIWQPRFYDHIIRNDQSYKKIEEYIINNPIKWELDKDNSENLYM